MSLKIARVNIYELHIFTRLIGVGKKRKQNVLNKVHRNRLSNLAANSPTQINCIK